jgi:secondary thiamine-phosphate synthase enzyme
MQVLTIKTEKQKQIVDLTALLNDLFMKNSYDTGICFLFTNHTSCCLTITNLDSGADADLLNAVDNMVPKLPYQHSTDFPHEESHIISTIMGPSLAIPIQSASMMLGGWQRVILLELNGPRERRIVVNYLPTK